GGVAGLEGRTADLRHQEIADHAEQGLDWGRGADLVAGCSEARAAGDIANQVVSLTGKAPQNIRSDGCRIARDNGIKDLPAARGLPAGHDPRPPASPCPVPPGGPALPGTPLGSFPKLDPPGPPVPPVPPAPDPAVLSEMLSWVSVKVPEGL